MVHNFPRGLSPFYIRLYQIVDDPSSDSIISWSKSSNNSFIIWNVREIRRKILPKSVEFGITLSQFISKLRSHGFKRSEGPGDLEFGHEDFVRGQPQLLNKMMMLEALTAKRKARKAKQRKAKKARVQVESLLQHLRI